MDADPRAGNGPPDPRRRVAWAGALALVALGLVASYWNNFEDLVRTWWRDPDYSHGFLVPAVAVVIFFRREAQRALRRHSAWQTAPGWALLGLTLLWRAHLREQGERWTETFTILPAALGLCWAAGGWPFFRRAWPAVAYLGFMLPLPARVVEELSLPLQRVATEASTQLLRLAGLWVMAEGNVITVGRQQLEVATACNGLSMLMCLAATVCATVAVIPLATWRRAVLVASILPIALGCNVLRITATAWCYRQFGPEVGGKYAHDAAGWLMMPAALVLVVLELSWFSWLVVEPPTVPPAAGDTGRAYGT